ncbi:hypothetical protein BH11PLA1_BH11PLA1_16670 [soil metagenome]
MKYVVRISVLFIAMFIAPSLAWAANVISVVSYQIGEWTFVPVVNQSVSPARTVGILALRDHGGTYGQNLVSVWYDRPQTTSDSWRSRAWLNGNHWVAINWVKTEFQVDASFDHDWPTTDSSTDVTAFETPVPYQDGFLVGDPYGEQWEGVPGREMMLEWLKNQGYPVSDVLFEMAAPESCSTSDWLDSMAAGGDFIAAGNDPDGSITGEYIIGIAAFCMQAQATPLAPVTISYGTIVCGSPTAWDTGTSLVGTPPTPECYYRRTRTCCRTNSLTRRNPTGPNSITQTTQCYVETEEYKEAPTPQGCRNLCVVINCNGTANQIEFTPTGRSPWYTQGNAGGQE